MGFWSFGHDPAATDRVTRLVSARLPDGSEVRGKLTLHFAERLPQRTADEFGELCGKIASAVLAGAPDAEHAIGSELRVMAEVRRALPRRAPALRGLQLAALHVVGSGPRPSPSSPGMPAVRHHSMTRLAAVTWPQSAAPSAPGSGPSPVTPSSPSRPGAHPTLPPMGSAPPQGVSAFIPELAWDDTPPTSWPPSSAGRSAPVVSGVVPRPSSQGMPAVRRPGAYAMPASKASTPGMPAVHPAPVVRPSTPGMRAPTGPYAAPVAKGSVPQMPAVAKGSVPQMPAVQGAAAVIPSSPPSTPRFERLQSGPVPIGTADAEAPAPPTRRAGAGNAAGRSLAAIVGDAAMRMQLCALRADAMLARGEPLVRSASCFVELTPSMASGPGEIAADPGIAVEIDAFRGARGDKTVEALFREAATAATYLAFGALLRSGVAQRDALEVIETLCRAAFGHIDVAGQLGRYLHAAEGTADAELARAIATILGHDADVRSLEQVLTPLLASLEAVIWRSVTQALAASKSRAV